MSVADSAALVAVESPCGVLGQGEAATPANYGERVARAIRSMRKQAGLNTPELARALSDELDHIIRAKDVTRWETGTHVPKADVFLAVMQVTGLPDPETLSLNTQETLRQQVLRLERAFRQAQLKSGGRAPELPELPPEHRDSYLTMAQAAKMLGISRQTLYQWTNANRIPAYRWESKKVLVPSDVERALEEIRRKADTSPEA